jgi:hypothetical protein
MAKAGQCEQVSCWLGAEGGIVPALSARSGKRKIEGGQAGILKGEEPLLL